MAYQNPGRIDTSTARVCITCRAWPCRCQLARPEDKPMEFSVRHEPCACGGTIWAGGSHLNVAARIDQHNATRRHQAWRASQKEL